jgi:hypothetical protein
MFRNSNVSCGSSQQLHTVEVPEGAHHLKAKGAVDHEEDEVGNLADVDHRVQVVIALDEREAAAFAGDDGDGPADLVQRLLRVPPDEGLEQRRLADARRAHDRDYHRRRQVRRRPVHERDV